MMNYSQVKDDDISSEAMMNDSNDDENTVNHITTIKSITFPYSVEIEKCKREQG